MSDLAFCEFRQILEWVTKKKNKMVVFIDQWHPSSKTCSNCGYILEKIDLSIREWRIYELRCLHPRSGITNYELNCWNLESP